MSILYDAVNTVRFRYSVWRGTTYITDLNPYGGGVLTHEAASELQDSLQITFLAYSGVDFVTDTLRVECTVNGEAYPLGRYIVTTEQPARRGGVDVVQIEAYSLLWILKQCKTETVRTWTAGTAYTAVIGELLTEAGLTDYDIEPSTAVLATDRADWDMGTEYIEIINDLLAEINYNPIFADFSGTIRATKYEAPSLDTVTHTYKEGRDSVIAADYETEADRFDRANVFIAICDNPELDTVLRAEAVNADPSSPYSTVTLGRRIPRIERVDNTPSLADLQDTADRMRAESLQTTETVEIVTAIMPDHGANETLLVQVGGITGIYRETGFEITLSATGQMKHRGRRVIV